MPATAESRHGLANTGCLVKGFFVFVVRIGIRNDARTHLIG